MELRNIALSDLRIATATSATAGKRRMSRRSVRAAFFNPCWSAPRAMLSKSLWRRRRYFAAKQTAKEQDFPAEKVLLPCAVAAEHGDADAMEASLIENVARAPMDELQEYEALRKTVEMRPKCN
jgi:ParB family transcriptional regulator, chromosome partitioning protein